MVLVPILWPDTDLSLLAGIYPILFASWIAAAAVRQWGKISGVEA